jgi:uncharacterized protein (UPF0335 family)
MNKNRSIGGERLKSFIERIEKLEEERKAISGDIRDVYSEAKGGGFDVKTMRKVIGLRKLDAADRDEQDAILAMYMHALGMPTSAPVSYTSVVESDAGVIDKRAVQAIDLLTANVSIRDVVAATGMGHGSVQRLRQTLIRQGVPIGVPQDRGTPAETDRGGNDDALPVGGSGRVAPAAPPDAIAKSEAGASTREDDEATGDDVLAMQPAPPVVPPTPASDTPSPAGGESDAGAPPAASHPSHGDVPVGDPDSGWEKADSAATFFVGHAVAGGKEPHPGTPDRAMTEAVVARCTASMADLDHPGFLVRGTDANRAARSGR